MSVIKLKKRVLKGFRHCIIVHSIKELTKTDCHFHGLPQTMSSMFSTLGPLAEAWSGLKLVPTNLNGIRRYKNMSALTSHLDKLSTEVISAIINVGQEVEEDWPLYLRNVTVIHSKKILL